MCHFRFVIGTVGATYLLGAAFPVQATNIQFIAEGGWVLPESMTYVSYFGTLKNRDEDLREFGVTVDVRALAHFAVR